MDTPKKVRTRFAPSPTGYMHIGNLRTALYTYLFARHEKGTFILRVEDTDQEREVQGATEKIYGALGLAGIDWDEGPDKDGGHGPYIQSERKAMYRPYAEQLVEKGAAYYCFCTKEQLDERRAAVEAGGGTFKYDKHCLHNVSPEEAKRRIAAGEEHVIRQNIPADVTAAFDDVLYGHIEVESDQLDDNVLIKADGLPTYNFANVVDDHLMEITHVLRGNEYLSSTPKYNLLYKAFGWDVPQYVHLTPVMKDQTRKLSKRHGDPTFEDLLAMGYLAEAILNYIVLVGWNPGTNQEFFTRDELIDAFSLKGLSKSPAIFDMEKLTWFNAEYVRKMSPEAYLEVANPWLDKMLGDGRYDRGLLGKLLQPRTERFDALPAMVDFLVKADEYGTDAFVNKKSKSTMESSVEALAASVEALEGLTDWTEQGVHDCLLALPEKLQMKNGQLLWPVRIAMSGRASTPGGAIEIAVLLGKEETLRRLREGQEKLKNG